MDLCKACAPAERNNPYTIPANQWTQIEVDQPSLLVPTEIQTRPIYVSPEEPAANVIEAGIALPYGAYLPKPGRFWVRTAAIVNLVRVKLPVIATVQPVPEGCSLATSSQAALTTVASTALAANANRRFMFIQNNGTDFVRLRFDGTNPTSTVGVRLGPGDALKFDGPQLIRSAVLAIAESGTPTLDIVEGT